MEKIIFKLYQKFFGDYLLGKRTCVFKGCILILLVIFIVSLIFKLSLDVDTLFWFFSTVAQVIAFMVSLTAVAVIFRLQVISSRKDKLTWYKKNSSEKEIKEKIKDLIFEESLIQSQMIEFLVYSIFVIVFSFICLIFTNPISKFYLAFMFVGLLFFLSCYSFFLGIKLIATTIGISDIDEG